jgi:dTDP-glucose pyrophosphorylase
MISLVLAMAGKGSRVSEEFLAPKPLIIVNKKPLFAWALSGLPKNISSELIIITNPKVSNNPKFDELIEQFSPPGIDTHIVTLNEETSGQGETVLLGTRDLSSNNGLLVFNCDTYISNNFPNDYSSWDGILGTFYSKNPEMSYVKSVGDIVTATVEKKVVSKVASTGLYYFKSRELFQDAYSQTHHQRESFIAPMYNYLIDAGYSVKKFNTDIVFPLGTQNEIKDFSNIEIDYLR